MGSLLRVTCRSADVVAGPVVEAPSRQHGMKAEKESSSSRCSSVSSPWSAVGATALKMDARMSSVSGAPRGGLSCALTGAGLSGRTGVYTFFRGRGFRQVGIVSGPLALFPGRLRALPGCRRLGPPRCCSGRLHPWMWVVVGG